MQRSIGSTWLRFGPNMMLFGDGGVSLLDAVWCDNTLLVFVPALPLLVMWNVFIDFVILQKVFIDLKVIATE